MLQAQFPSLEELMLLNTGDTIYDIWGNDNDASSFCKLKSIYLEGWKKLETVIPLAMSDNLRNLEYLSVTSCPRLKKVFQHSSLVRDLINLHQVIISSCEMMITDGKGEEEHMGFPVVLL